MSRKTCGLSWLASSQRRSSTYAARYFSLRWWCGPGHAAGGRPARGRRDSPTTDAEQRLAAAAHGDADPVRREPERLVAPAEDLPEPVGGDAVRRLGHQLDGDEPLPERQVRAVEERAGGDAELVAARVAVPLVAGVEPEQAVVLVAARALDAAGPAQLLQVEAAALLELVGLVRRSRRSCGSRVARASRSAITSWVRLVVRISRRSFVCRRGKKPRASSLGGCRKTGSCACLGHCTGRTLSASTPGGVSSIENASGSEGSRRPRTLANRCDSPRARRGRTRLVRPRRVGPPGVGPGPAAFASGRSSGWSSWWLVLLLPARPAGRGRGRDGRRGPPAGGPVRLTMSSTCDFRSASIVVSCAAVSLPAATAASSFFVAAATIASSSPATVLPCALATSASVLPASSCVRSCAAVRPR